MTPPLFPRIVKLPAPRRQGRQPLEQVMAQRRSVREFSDAPLTLDEVSQLLWAAQGITATGYLRTAPSAGALYPLEIHLAAGNVEGLNAGAYRYRPQGHVLKQAVAGDKRRELAAAALNQEWVEQGAAVFVFAAVFRRTTRKYGKRGIQYAHLETGHAAQNVFLQAVALGLATVVVGAFDDKQVQHVMHLTHEETPLCLMPVGKS
ncbi:MAG: SagB/ThcOx family dehydrogenase [Gammaproteobacteria bacterium]|nr:MAG: SagB/ThcOx family dehydrogenase [Gammaproteobacteria bacterium]